MEIEWIGTGSGLNPALRNTSFLVRNGTNRTLLVDCGSTVPLELIRSGKLKDVTDVLVTHAHADHIGGLEGLGFMNYFVYKRREDARPNLYVATDGMVKKVWNSLKEGMETGQWWNEEMLAHCRKYKNNFDMAEREGVKLGLFRPFTLESYFKVHAGEKHLVAGLPGFKFFHTLHAPFIENYGVSFGNDVWYSGDSIEVPKTDAKLVFQDCQFFEGGIHISYEQLRRELTPEMKARTHLVHLGGGWDKKDARADGFAGFVKPGDKFEI